jgi:hypothetical protein
VLLARRDYQYGAAGRMNVDDLPFTGFQTTWSVKPGAPAPYKPDYRAAVISCVPMPSPRKKMTFFGFPCWCPHAASF